MKVYLYSQVPLYPNRTKAFEKDSDRKSFLNNYLVTTIETQVNYNNDLIFFDTSSIVIDDINYVRIEDKIATNNTLISHYFVKKIDRSGGRLCRVFLESDKWQNIILKKNNADNVDIFLPLQAHGTYNLTNREYLGGIQDLPVKRIEDYSSISKVELITPKKYYIVAFMSCEAEIVCVCDTNNGLGFSSYPTAKQSISNITNASIIKKEQVISGSPVTLYTDKAVKVLACYLVPVDFVVPITVLTHNEFHFKYFESASYSSTSYYEILPTPQTLSYTVDLSPAYNVSVGTLDTKINLEFRNKTTESVEIEVDKDIDTFIIRMFAQNKTADITKSFMVDFAYNDLIANRAQHVSSNTLGIVSSGLQVVSGIASTAMGNPLGLVSTAKGAVSLAGNIAEANRSEPSTVNEAGGGIPNLSYSSGLFYEKIYGINDTDISNAISKYGYKITEMASHDIYLCLIDDETSVYIQCANIEYIKQDDGKVPLNLTREEFSDIETILKEGITLEAYSA